MSGLRFSRLAHSDLLQIGRYTLEEWGPTQASRYLDDLYACCRALVKNAALGRCCDDVRRGLRRMEQGKHIIFYRESSGEILVSRILHQRMLPDRRDIP